MLPRRPPRRRVAMQVVHPLEEVGVGVPEDRIRPPEEESVVITRGPVSVGGGWRRSAAVVVDRAADIMTMGTEVAVGTEEMILSNRLGVETGGPVVAAATEEEKEGEIADEEADTLATLIGTEPLQIEKVIVAAGLADAWVRGKVPTLNLIRDLVLCFLLCCCMFILYSNILYNYNAMHSVYNARCTCMEVFEYTSADDPVPATSVHEYYTAQGAFLPTTCLRQITSKLHVSFVFCAKTRRGKNCRLFARSALARSPLATSS